MAKFQHIAFFVQGTPRPAGSKRFFSARQVVDMSGKAGTAWRKKVKQAAKEAMEESGYDITESPVELWIDFSMPRPKHHYSKKGGLTAKYQGQHNWHIIRPDATKLLRSAEDAMTGVVWKDDAQVVDIQLCKTWAIQDSPDEEKYGAHIRIELLCD